MLDVHDHIMIGMKNGKRGMPTSGISFPDRCPSASLGQITGFTSLIDGESSEPPKIINELEEHRKKMNKRLSEKGLARHINVHNKKDLELIGSRSKDAIEQIDLNAKCEHCNSAVDVYKTETGIVMPKKRQCLLCGQKYKVNE